jgi:hypothetical protein
MAEPDSIAGPTMGTPATIAIVMAVPRIGATVPGMPMARGAARQAGMMVREAPPDGAEARRRGTMDPVTLADTAEVQLRGAVGRAPFTGPTVDRVAGGADIAAPG